MIAERRIPVPVADKMLTLKTAASAFGAVTTGGIFCTSSWRPATRIFSIQSPSRDARTCGVPQRKTNTPRMIHGVQARRRAANEWAVAGIASGASDGGAFGIGTAGLHTFKKS